MSEQRSHSQSRPLLETSLLVDDALNLDGICEEEKAGATAFQTGLNMLNELEGAGLLGMPFVILLGGWASLPLLAFVGLLAGFTGWCLAACMYDPNGRRARESYAELGGACYGNAGARAVLWVQMINLCSVGVVYLVLIASCMHGLWPLVRQSDYPGIPSADHRLYTLIATACVLPTVHIGGYRKLSVLSLLGVICLMAVFGLGVGYSIDEIVGKHGGALAPLPATKLKSLPAAFSMLLFAFSAHGIFPGLEASMQRPERFPTVVSFVFATNIIVKVVFGLACFYAFGAATEPVVSNNLPPVPQIVVSVLIVANTFFSFALPLVPVFRHLGCDHGSQQFSRCTRFFMRSGVVLGCGAVGLLLPSFDLAMGIMGSLTLPFLTFIFPAMFYRKLHGGKQLGGSIAAVIVVTVGAMGLVTGLASNIDRAVHA